MILGAKFWPSFNCSNLTIQRLALVAIVILVFWNGLWGGAPRSDQLPYLHQISQYSNLWDIVINSPSWNRTQSAGDFILFRPILYLQLGFFYYTFGYNFFYWQLADLVLHVLVVGGLYSLLIHGRLKNTIYPFLISVLFGCSFIASELVLWNHISGYLTFSLLSLYCIFFIVKLLSTSKTYFGYFALALGVMGEFTYELGVLLNLLIASVLFYNYKLKNCSECLDKNLLILSILFLCGVMLYPILSLSDLISRDAYLSLATDKVSRIRQLPLAVWYTFEQIIFWLGGWVFPFAYKIGASDRMYFDGYKLFSWKFLLIFIIVLLTIFIIVFQSSERKFVKYSASKGCRLSVFCVLIFLFAYSFVISYGRALPRGIEYILGINIYYSYIACLSVAVGCALYFIEIDKESGRLEVNRKKDIDPISSNVAVIFLLAELIICNAISTYQIASSYRYSYSSPRLEVIEALGDWKLALKKNAISYFYIDESCDANNKLSWFTSDHFRRFSNWSGPVTMADVLFPENSLQLNKEFLIGKTYEVTRIACKNHN